MNGELLVTGEKHPMTRREFLWFMSLSAVGFMAGCATSPVTGRRQLMLVSGGTG